MTQTFACGFGIAHSGLGTVGYTVLTAAGAVSAARSQAGVVELPAGTGNYGAPITVADGFVGFLVWDTGGGSPLYLTDEINHGLSAGDVQAALTSQGYTAVRAPLLERLDVAVSSRSTYAGADTTGVTTLLSRIGAPLTITLGRVDVNDRTGFALSSSEHAAVQADAVAALAAQGYSALRAAGLDRLDAAVSSRLASTSLPAFPTNFGLLAIDPSGTMHVGTNLDKAGYALSSADHAQVAIDVAVALAAPMPVSYQPSSVVSYLKTNLNAPVGSRLDASAYAPPPTVAAIAAAVGLPAFPPNFDKFAIDADGAVTLSSGGFGTRAVTIAFVDQGGNPMPNARFALEGIGQANAGGDGTFVGSLDDGDYTVLVTPQANVVWPVAHLHVDAAHTSFTVTGAIASIPAATSPDQCVVYVDLEGDYDGAEGILTVLRSPVKLGGRWLVSSQQRTKADPSGRIAFTAVPQGCEILVEVRAAKLQKQFVVPAQTTYQV